MSSRVFDLLEECLQPWIALVLVAINAPDLPMFAVESSDSLGSAASKRSRTYSNVSCSSLMFSMAAAWMGNADRVDENKIMPKNVGDNLIPESCAFNCAAASCSVVQCSVNDVPLTNLVLNSVSNARNLCAVVGLS